MFDPDLNPETPYAIADALDAFEDVVHAHAHGTAKRGDIRAARSEVLRHVVDALLFRGREAYGAGRVAAAQVTK